MNRISSGMALTKKPLFISSLIFLVIVIIEYLLIILINKGHFIYTLDDPYIHLSMAENILKGHYGINIHEYSSPSSSILWPFILAPFSKMSLFEYSPLFLNLIITLLIIYFYFKIITLCFSGKFSDHTEGNVLLTYLLISLILSTNIISLIFMGMENSLQVLLVVILLFNVFSILSGNKVSITGFALLIITAPLVRYENILISIFALMILLYKKRFVALILSLIIMTSLLSIFSYYLVNNGLNYLPDSILVKLDLSQSGFNIKRIASGIINSFKVTRGFVLFAGIIFLLHPIILPKVKTDKILPILVILPILGHLFTGSLDWYNRHGIYIWTFLILNLLFINKDKIYDTWFVDEKKVRLSKSIIYFSMIQLIVCSPYLSGILTIPLASNNIYEQQYQMHRFVKEFYKEPIAANDIGLVSFNNKNYVLDLLGLANYKNYLLRKDSRNSLWMENQVNYHNINLVIIYDDLFSTIPPNWTKIGELVLRGPKITVGGRTVSFYATKKEKLEELIKKLKTFKESLPYDNFKITIP